MTEYRFDLQQFPAIRNRSLKRLIPFMLLMIVILVCSIVFDDFNPDRDMESFLLMLIVLISIFGVIIYRAVKRMKANCEKFRLVVEDDCLVSTRLGSNLKIPFTDISRISESKNGTICIIGKRDIDVIAVSRFIENYSDLRSTLYAIKPFVSTRSDMFWQKFGSLIVFLPALLMLVVLTSENKLVIVIGGFIVLIALGWYFFKMVSIMRADKKIQWKSMWVLLILLSIALKLYFTLS